MYWCGDRAVRDLEAEVRTVTTAGRELQLAEEASLGDDQVRKTLKGVEEGKALDHTKAIDMLSIDQFILCLNYN